MNIIEFGAVLLAWLPAVGFFPSLFKRRNLTAFAASFLLALTLTLNDHHIYFGINRAIGHGDVMGVVTRVTGVGAIIFMTYIIEQSSAQTVSRSRYLVIGTLGVAIVTAVVLTGTLLEGTNPARIGVAVAVEPATAFLIGVRGVFAGLHGGQQHGRATLSIGLYIVAVGSALVATWAVLDGVGQVVTGGGGYPSALMMLASIAQYSAAATLGIGFGIPAVGTTALRVSEALIAWRLRRKDALPESIVSRTKTDYEVWLATRDEEMRARRS